MLSFTGGEVDRVVDAHLASLEGTHEIDRAEGLLDFNGRDADLKPVDVDKRLLISARYAHRNHAALGGGLVRLADRVSELTVASPRPIMALVINRRERGSAAEFRLTKPPRRSWLPSWHVVAAVQAPWARHHGDRLAGG